MYLSARSQNRFVFFPHMNHYWKFLNLAFLNNLKIFLEEMNSLNIDCTCDSRVWQEAHGVIPLHDVYPMTFEITDNLGNDAISLGEVLRDVVKSQKKLFWKKAYPKGVIYNILS